jgi:nicotinic acid mononucleotide adenylyltransferase
MSFRNKYLKYKEKYLNLKNLIGGSSHSKHKCIIIPGSFSPFTNAHLQSIEAAVKHYMKLDYTNTNIRVIIVPVPDTYNKPSTFLPKDRPPHSDYLSEGFRNSIIERGLQSLREKYGGITFMLSTVEQDNKPRLSNTGLVLQQMHTLGHISQNKDENITFVGTDNALKVSTWGDPQLMFTHSNLGIINREGESTSNDYADLVFKPSGSSMLASYQFKDESTKLISVYYGEKKPISLDQLKSDRGELVTEHMQGMLVIPLKIEFSSSLLRKYVRQELTEDDDRLELIIAINQLNPSGRPILDSSFTIEELYKHIQTFIPYLTPATYDELKSQYNANSVSDEGGI